MMTQLLNPAPIPTVMSQVSGMRIIVSKAGIPSSTSATGMSLIRVNIR